MWAGGFLIPHGVCTRPSFFRWWAGRHRSSRGISACVVVTSARTKARRQGQRVTAPQTRAPSLCAAQIPHRWSQLSAPCRWRASCRGRLPGAAHESDGAALAHRASSLGILRRASRPSGAGAPVTGHPVQPWQRSTLVALTIAMKPTPSGWPTICKACIR